MPDPRNIRILFLGTPEFAATCLQKLIDEGALVVAVVTAPDKPAGRGLQIRKTAVKEVAEAAGIPVLQPEKLKDPDFLETLRSYKPELGIVVAFRMLPEVVWQMPPMGTFNLHASLLPSYRGAAPIHWALIRGEKETGITTFFLRHEIDTGDLLLQESVTIPEEENLGSLYDRLRRKGAELVWKTVQEIGSGSLQPFPQDESRVSQAPKLTPETGHLDFHESALQVHNRVRGLSPAPGAYCFRDGKRLKLLKTCRTGLPSGEMTPGVFKSIGPGKLAVSTADEWLEILELQPEGKRIMTGREYLAGHNPEKL